VEELPGVTKDQTSVWLMRLSEDLFGSSKQIKHCNIQLPKVAPL